MTNYRGIAGILVFIYAIASVAQAPESPLTRQDREWLLRILHTVHDDVRKNYYDPAYHGLDLDQRFLVAETKLGNAANLNYAMAAIAGAVTALNDSHTYFLPPSRPWTHDYGWRMQAEGDTDCFITAVRPGSDAEKKGLRPGDQLVTVAGFSALREDVWKMEYVYSVLRPQFGLRLVFRTPDGSIRQLDTMAELRSQKWEPWNWEEQVLNAIHRHQPRTVEYGKQAVFYQLPDFAFDPDLANGMLDKIRGHEALVLDLRGNPGGYVVFLTRFLGGMFDHEVKIGDRIGRKPMNGSVTKSRGDKTFQGKIVVLIDSRSASAAELFARIMQIEKRGTVVGDRSSGMVMESKVYPHQVLNSSGALHYAVSITDANIVMSDGKSLEHTGVIPDERIVPSAADLAAGRYPALVRAAELVGIKLTPEEAGKIFPVRWPAETDER